VADVLEQRWRELGAFIRDQRRMGQLSLRKLADRAGVSNPYLSQIERGLRRPSAEILQQIAHALEISAETLYVRAGILDERDPDLVDVVSVIREDPALTDDQKQTLTHIYRSFTAANGTADLATPVSTDAPDDATDQPGIDDPSDPPGPVGESSAAS
jgi:transcriptional regulator with XRE-family HTH domain